MAQVQADAAFWRQKYIELLVHTTQVIGKIGAPLIMADQMPNPQAPVAAAPPAQQQPSATTAAPKNGAPKGGAGTSKAV
jgi:hypothetical protein